MRYLIYKIINTVNGRYYIGRHSTNNINDDYMGSGKAIINAIKKYGKDAFVKEIIAEAFTTEGLWELERQIVNDEIVNDPLSYNMTYGGKSYLDGLKRYNPKKFIEHQSDAGKLGGEKCYYQNKTENERYNWHSLGGRSTALKMKNSKNHPFYNGIAASKGGKALKGIVELWSPTAIATNKNQKDYKSGDCVRTKPNSPKYQILINEGWLPISMHKQKNIIYNK